MEDIPHAVLSDQFQERMQGRRLRAAVFVTYQFEPGFFEQEVLPVLLDVPLSHAVAIRLVQLEEALRSVEGEISVYYDANGLMRGDEGSAKLDVRRVPVQHRHGIFHAKNVFLLVEAEEEDEEGHRPQTLIVASLSANLTRSGWWENVEGCHIEEIGEGEKTRLKDDLASFLEFLRNKTEAQTKHLGVRELLAFLRRVDSRMQKSSSGQLHTHFYRGTESLPDFLEQVAGSAIRGAYLEIISPYFDDADTSNPLETLIERFQPKEVRVSLPRSIGGEVTCRPTLYEAVRRLPLVAWGRLPKELVRLGKGADAGERRVHAKVYRFFTQSPKREVCFISSANLTRAAHQLGGNVETGFLVDLVPSRRPDFWMKLDGQVPTAFQVRTEDEASAASGGTRLNLRYHWDRNQAEAFWDAPNTSPSLAVKARGIEIVSFSMLSSRTWTVLHERVAESIASLLIETSIFEVHGETPEPGLLLVQEEGMAHKPSILMSLSVADILRYWALLTVEQRAAFLEARMPEVALHGAGADLVAGARIVAEGETLFDRFAGVFHAFGCLERDIRAALDAGRDKDVEYRLFGRKYDSLGSLLDRISTPGDDSKDVDQYVIVLCARQLCREIARDYADAWVSHAAEVKQIEARFTSLSAIRDRLIASNSGDFAQFLSWFDDRFLRRAIPVEPDPA
jgi:hypothetical protein